MKKFLTSIITALSVAAPLQSQHNTEPPKLVVGIVIDQLRGDYITQFYEMFGEGGFKRLIRDGAYFQNMKFDFPVVDQTSAVATIYTGTNPWFHGVIGASKFDREKRKPVSLFLDPGYLGNFTDETVSPRNLLVSSLTDELKIATEGFGSIYSFAPNCEEALITAGHAGDGAFWIDNRNKKWATSTYFQNIPICFENYNSKQPLSDLLDNKSWNPLQSLSFYKYLPYKQKDFGFSYSFKKGKNSINEFKTSALVNEEVNRMAINFFDNQTFGKHSYPDFISLNLYAGSFRNRDRNNYSIEIQDLYLRLDKQLELLLNKIEASVGLKNALVFIASTGYFEEEQNNPERLNIPSGIFYTNRATALLNMYLMSIYGQGDWVLGYHKNEFFLNKKLLEDKLIDQGKFQEKAAEFLIQMSGVQDVITAHSLLHGRANDQVESSRNGYNKKFSGDLLVELQPDWTVANEDIKTDQAKIKSSAILTPLFFIGHNVKPTRIQRAIKATDIASSLAFILRIRAPSASKGNVLPELY